MNRFFVVVLAGMAVGCSAGCRRLPPSRSLDDHLTQVSVASLHYWSERNGLPYAHLFDLHFAFRRTIRDEDSLRHLEGFFRAVRCREPIDYRHVDADLSVALDWQTGRRDTISFRDYRMRIEGQWCKLDTNLLLTVGELLPDEHRAALDTFLYYWRQYGTSE